MRRGALGPNARLRADILVFKQHGFLFAALGLVHLGEDECREEGRRDRPQGRILGGVDGLLETEDGDPYRRAQDHQRHGYDQPDEASVQGPLVVRPFQNMDRNRIGKFTDAAMAKARPTMKRDVLFLESDTQDDRDDAKRHCCHLGDTNLLLLGTATLAEHAGIEVVRYC